MPQVIERKQQFRAGNDNGIHAIALGHEAGNRLSRHQFVLKKYADVRAAQLDIEGFNEHQRLPSVYPVPPARWSLLAKQGRLVTARHLPLLVAR